MSHFNVTAAAEAVVDAYNSSPPCNDHVLDHKYCMAAAIRELSNNFYHPKRSDAHDLWNEGFQYAENVYRAMLLNIADELEGVKHGIYASSWPREGYADVVAERDELKLRLQKLLDERG